MRRDEAGFAVLCALAEASCGGGDAGTAEQVGSTSSAQTAWLEWVASVNPSDPGHHYRLTLPEGTNACGRNGSLSHILQQKGAWSRTIPAATTTSWARAAGSLLSDSLPVFFGKEPISASDHTVAYWAILSAHESQPHADLVVKLIHVTDFDAACQAKLFTGKATSDDYLLVVNGASSLDYGNPGHGRPSSTFDTLNAGQWTSNRKLDDDLTCFADYQKPANQKAVWDGEVTWLIVDPPRGQLQ